VAQATPSHRPFDFNRRFTMLSSDFRLIPLFSTVLLGAGLAQAQEPPADRTQPGAWTLNAGFGAGGATSSGYGEFLEQPQSFEVNIAKGRGAWRFGAGLQFGSMDMKPPYEDQLEWARLETHLFATRVFNHGGRVRPYLQARIGIERIHPRSELFWFEDPENLEPGESPTKAANGFGFTLQPGVEFQLTKSLALDVAGWWTAYKTGDYSLTPPLHGPLDPPLSQNESASSGQEYGIRAGLTWRPLVDAVRVMPQPVIDPATGTLAPLPPPDEHRDAWGVPRSWGWATGEMLAINFVASMSNEYVRNANFNQISPRSFWANLEEGWTWDDNEFQTNQLIHPFNGAAYFNAARSNGIGFWGSSAMSLAGAFVWECCGETHPMSWNDMISTGIGGIARGEFSYRISSLILDNTKQGGRRILREVGALLFDPVRGANRFISGRGTRVQGNPVDPYDWRPPSLGLQLNAGARIIGEGQSISENTNTYGFIEGTIQFGSPFWNERRRPFDRFDADMQLNYGDKTRVGLLTIRGDLASWPLGDRENPKHALAIIQDFDYINNEAYEYGGQSFGLTLFSGFGQPQGTRLVTRLTGYLTAGAAVNADYSFLAEVPDRERFREYDYGPGVGAGLEGLVSRKGRPFLFFGYRYTFVDVKNGSLWNPDDGGPGSSATHQVHRAKVRLVVPVTKTLGVGADATLFYRDSKYSLEALEDRTQRNPEVRVYLSWDLGYTRRQYQD
jgi:hypothetical protein